MALTVTELYDAMPVNQAGGTGSGDYTSTTFNTTSGDLLIAIGRYDVQGASGYAAAIPTPTTTGHTWSLLSSLTADPGTTFTAIIKVWVADATTQTGVTIAQAGTGVWDTATNAVHMTVVAVSGGAASAASALGAKIVSTSTSGSPRDPGALSITLDATPASTSVTFGVFAGDGGVETASVTEGAGWTELSDIDGGNPGPYLLSQVQYRAPGSTSTAVAWVDVAAGTIHDIYDYAAVGFEIKAGGSGITGTAAVTLASFTSSASGTVTNPSYGASTLGAFTSAASGTVTPPNNVVYVKEVGAVTDTTAGTTSAITVAAGGVPTGDLVVVLGACDNTGSSGAATTITVTDTRTNTWATLSPQAIADPGAASAGIQGFIAWTKVATAMQAGDTITITYGNSTTAKAINAQQFSNMHTGSPILSGSYATQDNQTGTTVSVAATPGAAGAAVVALVAVEGGTADAYTQDSDTTNGSWVGLTRRGSGTTTSGATLNSAYKIVTAAGAQTYDPTLGTARDHAAAIVVIAVNHSGTATPTLGAFTSSASGTVTSTVTGTAAVTLGAFTSSASGTLNVTGTASPTLAAFTTSASGTLGVTGTAAITLGSFTASTPATVLYPDSISGNKFLDQNGRVFPIRAVAIWGGPQNLTTAQIDAIVAQAASRGFNDILICMFGYATDGTWDRYHDVDGNAAFTGSLFSSSLGSAWAKVDRFVTQAAARGVNIGLTLYSGFTGGATHQGIYDDLVAASSAAVKTWGTNVATRYAAYDNIIWHVVVDSGDYTSKMDDFFDGVNDVDAVGRRAILLEPANGQTAGSQGFLNATNWPNMTLWADALYTYDATAVEAIEAVYSATDPVWDCEPVYVGNPVWALSAANTRQNHRERTLAVEIEGLVGGNHGHEELWPCGKSGIYDVSGVTFDTALDTTEMVEMSYAWTVLDLARTTDFQPSSSFVTTGTGTGDTKAAVGASATTALAYFPTSRTVVVDTTILTGTGNVRLRWYDPTAGTYSTINSGEAQNASRSVTYPSNHGDGTSDFVLVVDVWITGTAAVTLASFTASASGTVAPPGVTGTAAVTLGSFTASASGTVGRTGTAAVTLAAFTASAAGTIGETGSAAVALAAFTTSASGAVVANTGTAAVTLGTFASAASGTFSPAGSGFGNPTLSPFTATATGTIGETGTAAPTLGAFTVSSTGTVTPPAITGTAVVTLAVFVAAASGTSTAPGSSGTAAVTLAPFTSSASGTVTPPGVVGNAAITLGNATAIGTGKLGVTGTAAITLGLFLVSALPAEAFARRPHVTSGRPRIIRSGIPNIIRGRTR